MKKIIDFFDIDLLFKCFCMWIFLYSGFVAVVEVSLYYILIPILIHFVILHFSLIPQNDEEVKAVFGENPRTKFRESIDLDRSNDLELNSSFSIAHKAAVLDFSDSSVEAVKLCSQNGCKFVHLDVNVTTDNVPVINRQSNLYFKSGEYGLVKSIEECDYNELSNGLKDNIIDQDLCILDEILPTIENLEVKVIFNLIHSSYYKSSDSVINTMLAVYQKNPFLYKRSAICSTNPVILYKIRKHDPSILVALKWTGFVEQTPITISWLKNFRCNNTVKQSILELADSGFWWLLNNFLHRIIGISAVILPKEIITPKVVENWERKRIRCIAGVVNLSTEKSYYANALGIAYLTDTLINENE